MPLVSAKSNIASLSPLFRIGGTRCDRTAARTPPMGGPDRRFAPILAPQVCGQSTRGTRPHELSNCGRSLNRQATRTASASGPPGPRRTCPRRAGRPSPLGGAGTRATLPSRPPTADHVISCMAGLWRRAELLVRPIRRNGAEEPPRSRCEFSLVANGMREDLDHRLGCRHPVGFHNCPLGLPDHQHVLGALLRQARQ